MLAFYWAVVGAIAGMTAESVMGYLDSGISGIYPWKVAGRAIWAAMNTGGTFWLVSRPTVRQPEQRA